KSFDVSSCRGLAPGREEISNQALIIVHRLLTPTDCHMGIPDNHLITRPTSLDRQIKGRVTPASVGNELPKMRDWPPSANRLWAPGAKLMAGAALRPATKQCDF